jgi:hypothetical protein
MSLVKIIAIEPFNGLQPGQALDTSEREAKQLIDRGLAKMAVTVANKMAVPVPNKANPTRAAGAAQRSFASPAAPVSPPTIAQRLDAGAPVPTLALPTAPARRGPGRPRKIVE